MNNIVTELSTNTYPGRGIVIGKSADGKNAVFAYFIMGRSENSRNRVFEAFDGGMRTKAFDESKLIDPSLIIYNPYLKTENVDIIGNYSKSQFNQTSIVGKNGVAPTVTENHG